MDIPTTEVASYARPEMDSLNTTQSPRDDAHTVPAPFSPRTLFILELCIYMLATGAFATFGVVSNVINFIVFYRQGILSSSSTAHLTGLALSDFFSCLTTLVRIIAMYFMHFAEGGSKPSSAYSIALISSAYVGPFTQMTCWITAFTSFERVVCILFPFNVKAIFTPKRSLAVVVSIFIGTFIIDSPTIFRSYLSWNVNPETNTSYIEIYYTGYFSPELYKQWALISPTILRFTAIFIVAVCNIVLFWKIKSSQKFRKSSRALSLTPAAEPSQLSISTVANESKNGIEEGGVEVERNKTIVNTVSITVSLHPRADVKVKTNPHPPQTKEMRLLRMITVISVVFVVGYTACIPHSVLFYFLWTRNVDYHFYHMYLCWLLVNFIQIINSSTNILIFYKMSSRYKEDFDKLLCSRTKKICS